jgi:hypothetical protein
MKRTLIGCAVLISVVCCASANAATSKQEDIRKLMDVVGVKNLALQMAQLATQGMMQAYRTTMPDMPDRAASVIEREMVAVFTEGMDAPGGLFERVVPVYDKYFTHEEIKALMAFYQTPTGKKAIAVMPQLVGECSEVGRQWGTSLGPEIEKRAKAALQKEKLIPAD